MELLTRDELYQIAIELDLPSLLKFCSTSKKMNSLVCLRNDIWYYKLNQDFPDWRKYFDFSLAKSLLILKYKLNMKENIYQLVF